MGDHLALLSESQPFQDIDLSPGQVLQGVGLGLWVADRHRMAAMVGGVIGLQHASMAVYNAYADRVPVLIRIEPDRFISRLGGDFNLEPPPAPPRKREDGSY